MDTHSKWLEVHVYTLYIVTISSQLYITPKLRAIFTAHGLRKPLFFISAEFKKFLSHDGILLAPYHPAANRLAERAVQTLKGKQPEVTSKQNILDDQNYTTLYIRSFTSWATPEKEVKVSFRHSQNQCVKEEAIASKEWAWWRCHAPRFFYRWSWNFATTGPTWLRTCTWHHNRVLKWKMVICFIDIYINHTCQCTCSADITSSDRRLPPTY